MYRALVRIATTMAGGQLCDGLYTTGLIARLKNRQHGPCGGPTSLLAQGEFLTEFVSAASHDGPFAATRKQ
jgi:hypothetical protein